MPGETGINGNTLSTIDQTDIDNITSLTLPSITNNTDLPIAMDKDNANTPGGGITHTTTPITMDIVVDDTVSTPSTLTINSVTGGTGTDLASTNFRTKSVNIAVADPPAIFNYDLKTNTNTVYPGDDLIYTYQVSNRTPIDITTLDLVTLLPSNNKTSNNIPLSYTLDQLALTITNPYTDTESGTETNTNTPTIPTDLTLYYTTDPAAIELSGDTNTGTDTNASPNTTLDTINAIAWHELDLNNLITTNPDSIKLDNTDPNNPKLTITIPEDYLVAAVGNSDNTNEGTANSIDILAFRLTKDTISTNQQLTLNPKLTNIITTPNTTISNNITYLSWYDGTNTQTVTNTNNQDTTFNTSIGISLSNPNLTTTITPGSVVLGSSNNSRSSTNSITNTNTTTTSSLSTNVSIKARVINGYTLTVKTTSPNGELIRVAEGSNVSTDTNIGTQLNNTIPSLPIIPSTTTTSWAVQVLDSNTLDSNTWSKLPGTSNDPLSLHKVDSYGSSDTTITTNYGIGTDMSTMAGTYRAELVYTVTEVQGNAKCGQACAYMVSLYLLMMGCQLSWLEHLVYTEGVRGSSPLRPTIYAWGTSSFGQSASLAAKR